MSGHKHKPETLGKIIRIDVTFDAKEFKYIILKKVTLFENKNYDYFESLRYRAIARKKCTNSTKNEFYSKSFTPDREFIFKFVKHK